MSRVQLLYLLIKKKKRTIRNRRYLAILSRVNPIFEFRDHASLNRKLHFSLLPKPKPKYLFTCHIFTCRQRNHKHPSCLYMFWFIYLCIDLFMGLDLLISSLESLQQRHHSCSIQRCHGSSKGFASESCKLRAKIFPAHTPPWHLATIPVRRISSPATNPGLVSPLWFGSPPPWFAEPSNPYISKWK